MYKCANLQLRGTSSPRLPTGALPGTPLRGLPSTKPPGWPMFILGLSGRTFPPKKSEILPQNNSTRPKIQRHDFMPYLLGPNHCTF